MNGRWNTSAILSTHKPLPFKQNIDKIVTVPLINRVVWFVMAQYGYGALRNFIAKNFDLNSVNFVK